jgi:hypothetical protein
MSKPDLQHRLERAIDITAYCMVRHELHQLLPILKRLEQELTRNQENALAYARIVLMKSDNIVDNTGRGSPAKHLIDLGK